MWWWETAWQWCRARRLLMKEGSAMRARDGRQSAVGRLGGCGIGIGLIAEGVKVIEPRVEGGIAGGGAGVLAVDGVKGGA